VLDLYPYGTTSPVYINVGSAPVQSASDATYFVAWIDRLTQAANSFLDWNSEAEKAHVLKQLSDARNVYARQLK